MCISSSVVNIYVQYHRCMWACQKLENGVGFQHPNARIKYETKKKKKGEGEGGRGNLELILFLCPPPTIPVKLKGRWVYWNRLVRLSAHLSVSVNFGPGPVSNMQPWNVVFALGRFAICCVFPDMQEGTGSKYTGRHSQFVVSFAMHIKEILTVCVFLSDTIAKRKEYID